LSQILKNEHFYQVYMYTDYLFLLQLQSLLATYFTK